LETPGLIPGSAILFIFMRVEGIGPSLSAYKTDFLPLKDTLEIGPKEFASSIFRLETECFILLSYGPDCLHDELNTDIPGKSRVLLPISYEGLCFRKELNLDVPIKSRLLLPISYGSYEPRKNRTFAACTSGM
jgi:hypothetical protein